MSYCIRCYKEKPTSEMKSEKCCILCADKRKNYYQNNSQMIRDKSKSYYEENKDEMVAWQKQYNQENAEQKAEYNKLYYRENKVIIVKNNMLNENERKKIDPVFKIRKQVSRTIWTALQSEGSSKNGHSVLQFLPYTIDELKTHLEKQFEPWMTWENHGAYKIDEWDDNDQATWTWNIDHIVPQSKLPYSDMNDDNFKKCWALDNLRPLSAKQNIKDNNHR